MAEAGLDIRDLELNALLEVTQAINNNLSETDLFRIYKFTLLADLKVRRMALFVQDNGWRCRVSFGSRVNWDGREIDPDFLSIKGTMTLKNANSDYSDFTEVLPVYHKARLLAIIFIGGTDDQAHSGYTFLQALTNIIIVAIENKKLARRELEQEAYRKELEIAKKVQNFLFPKSLPHTSKLKIEAVYLPHHDVGGDYYDYLAVDNDRFIVCVADVSGKGVPAALLMSNFQASLRTLVRKTLDPKEIVSELNHVVTTTGNGENFITFFLGMYDFNDHTFRYINCGHNPQYIFSEGKLISLDRGTTIIGMFDPLPFLEMVVIENLRNFFFFGYTDGLTETFNVQEEQFGNERLEVFLNAGIPTDLNGFHKDLLTAIDDFRKDEPHRDDITILSCVVHN